MFVCIRRYNQDSIQQMRSSIQNMEFIVVFCMCGWLHIFSQAGHIPSTIWIFPSHKIADYKSFDTHTDIHNNEVDMLVACTSSNQQWNVFPFIPWWKKIQKTTDIWNCGFEWKATHLQSKSEMKKIYNSN